jgi:LPS-assembly protein
MAKRGAWSIETRRALPGLAASEGRRRRSYCWRLLVCLCACLIGLARFGPAVAAGAGSSSRSTPFGNPHDLEKSLQGPKVSSTEPMLLQADEMIYDNENNRVTAKGNVEIYYGNYTLLADQVIYDRNANTLMAEGNVRIKDAEGAIITSDKMTLTDDLRDGFIEALKLVTKEDTRIVAETATREAGNVTVFQHGWFTPCKACEDHPERPPTWRIRATKIIHRKDEATITYRNAFFDLFGVPILWTPYFQSADPSVKRKSGFLMPSYLQSSQLGSTVRVPYYFALSDHYDFTFVPMFTQNEGTLLEGIWRQRLSNGGYNIDLAGVFTKGLPDSPANQDFRGSIVTQGKFALDPYWDWGWDITASTDNTFRRFYLLDTRLRTDEVSQVYLEGLHDRNYFSARFYQTQSLEFPDQPPDTEATVHPIIDYDYIVGQPILGGELSYNSNVMSFSSNDGTQSNRLITEANWRKQMIDGLGQVYTPFAQLRGDIYQVNDFVNPQTGKEENGPILRGDAVAGGEYRYPFIASTGSVVHTIEPIAQIIVRPNSVGDQAAIPNEDAKSLVFDDTLLFDIDKFSGYDRLETGTRSNVGVRYTAQLYSGAYARAVFGESFQLAGENPFPAQTGLGTDASDYVTGLYLQASSNLDFSAQTRFDQKTLEISRTDLHSSMNYGPVELAVNYADVQSVPELGLTVPLQELSLTDQAILGAGGVGLFVPRQEISSTGALKLTSDWALLGNLRYDLENNQPIAEGVGLRYQDDCFMLAVTYEQTFIQNQDLHPDQIVMVNFALKYLGAYQYSTGISGITGPATPTGIIP